MYAQQTAPTPKAATGGTSLFDGNDDGAADEGLGFRV